MLELSEEPMQSSVEDTILLFFSKSLNTVIVFVFTRLLFTNNNSLTIGLNNTRSRIASEIVGGVL